MLILLFDSIYLNQDFVKVSGDDVDQKVHLDAKRLMLMKQKGISIDANSQRNLKKKWEGFKCSVFNFGEKKITLTVKAAQQPKEKDKKASKKEAKGKVEQAPSNPDESKSIETYKTWRQKAVFVHRQQSLKQFHKEYQTFKTEITEKVTQNLKENDSFKQKWQAIAQTLYIK